MLLGMMIPVVASLVSAQYSGFLFEDIVNNSWLRFAIVFVLFFAILMFSVGKTAFGKSRGTAVIISGIVSLLISFSVSQTDLFYSYFGEEIGVWILGFALIIGIIFFVKIAYDGLGAFGAGIVLFIMWFVLRLYIDPYNAFPSSSFGDILLSLYELFTGWVGIVLIIILIVVFAWRKKKKANKGTSITVNS